MVPSLLSKELGNSKSFSENENLILCVPFFNTGSSLVNSPFSTNNDCFSAMPVSTETSDQHIKHAICHVFTSLPAEVRVCNKFNTFKSIRTLRVCELYSIIIRYIIIFR